MRPTLPCLACATLTAAASLGAEIHWDGGAGNTLWSQAGNWSGDTVPLPGDTVWFDAASGVPANLTLDTSYPDTGAPINLVFAAGADLAIHAAVGRELYVGSLSVLDAQGYTLHVPRNGTQSASGTMPAAGAVWHIAEGGTLTVLEDFGSKALATGEWSKTGPGTLRLGAVTWGTLSLPRLRYRALGGVTEFGYYLGAAANGITEVAPDATIRFLCYNPEATLATVGSMVYTAGVTGMAGTIDLGGFDQRFRALSGPSSGRIVGNGGIETVVFTLGVADFTNYAVQEADGAFAGSIEDGATGRLRLVLQGARAGYTQTLSGTSHFTGGTQVRSGRLLLAHATDTLADTGDVLVNGGTLDLGGASDVVGAVTVIAGDILGNGGTLQAASLTVDNAQAARIGPNLRIEGRATKTGAGSLALGGDLSVGEELEILSGAVNLEGGTVTGNVSLRGGALTGGTYSGVIAVNGTEGFGGRVAAEGELWASMTTVFTPGLVIDGSLHAMLSSFNGGPVTLNGTHELVWWFGVNRFECGLTYGASAIVNWSVSPEMAASYVDGSSEGERGVVFGAVDVGGPGLLITEGATLRVSADTGGGDSFWFNPRVFKVIGATAPDAITGLFRLEVMPGSDSEGWSLGQTSDGLYLYWSGQAQPAAVPEASAMGAAAGTFLLVEAWRRRRRATKDPASRRGR